MSRSHRASRLTPLDCRDGSSLEVEVWCSKCEHCHDALSVEKLVTRYQTLYASAERVRRQAKAKMQKSEIVIGS